MPMTDPLDEIMQAAERLRAVRAANDYRAGYGEAPAGLSDHDAQDWWIVKEEHDLSIMSKFALSVLPKGERPVPIDPRERIQQQVWWIDDWGRVRDGRIVTDAGIDRWAIKNTQNGITQWISTEGYRPYPTEADARLALHWQKLDELKAAAAQ